MRNNIVENVIVRLLRESHAAQTMGQAAFVKQSPRDITAVLYDQNQILDNISFFKKHLVDNDKIMSFLIKNVYKGVVQIKPPTGGPCRQAWQVTAVAGKGLGKTLYGLGYALSPSGLLMSDRKNVSPSARAAWTKAYNSGREKLPLDDVSMHDEKGEPTWRHTNHTPDPEDDCAAFSEFSGEQLNYAYKKEGWEDSLLDFLETNHKMTMGELAKLDKSWPSNIEEILWTFSRDFWDTQYMP
jgi:hypothetical protein